MTSYQQCYAELIHLTKIFLHREYVFKNSQCKDRVKEPAPPVSIPKPSPVSISKNEVPKPQVASTPPLSHSAEAAAGRIPDEMIKTAPRTMSDEEDRSGEAAASRIPDKMMKVAEKPSPAPALRASPQNNEKPSQKKRFALEPLNTDASAADLKAFWSLCENAFPQWKLSESTPSDAKGRKNKQAWMKNFLIPSVIIFSFNTDSQQLSFLSNLAQAITLRFAPAKVVSIPQLEKEGGLESFSSSPQLLLVIACDHELYMHPKMMQSLRLQEKEGKYFLGEIPLILFSDFSLYLKEPQLKAFVWRAICKEFANP